MRVADLWLSAGHEVWALTRNPQNLAIWEQFGIRGCLGDVTRPETLAGLPPVDAVLYAVGYQAGSEYTRHELHRVGLQNVVEVLAASDPVQALIYVSSTGVYGAASDAVVDEETPCRPDREGGAACLEAERYLLGPQCPYSDRALVLRLAGIYGPDRVPHHRALQRGDVTVSPLDAYLNLIHVDDAARCVALCAVHADLPNVYVVSDGHPVRRRDYYREILARMGMTEDEIRAMMARFRIRSEQRGRGGKRVSNAKLLRDLNWELDFPTYREGLAASIVD